MSFDPRVTAKGVILPIAAMLTAVLAACFVFSLTRMKAANHPIQLSGEVGRLEVERQPSPPVDR